MALSATQVGALRVVESVTLRCVGATMTDGHKGAAVTASVSALADAGVTDAVADDGGLVSSVTASVSGQAPFSETDAVAGTCAHCDASLSGRRAGTVYCSARCRVAAGRGPRASVASCVHCGAEFKPRRSDSRYCSARCRVAAHRARARPWAERTAEAYDLAEGDLWRTPSWLFRALDSEFHFTLDAASSGQPDALCEEWLTPEQDALSCEWPVYLHLLTGRGAAYCNPPYSRKGGGMLAWVEACLRARVRQTVVLVGPYRGDARWRALCREHADEIRLAGRVQFVAPPGLKRSTPSNDTVVVVFREGSSGPAKHFYWDPRP